MNSRQSLLAVLAVYGVLSLYRAVHFWITGFYVPDEYGYTVMALKGLIGYQARWFFNGLNILFFDLFRINQVSQLVVLLPLYIMTWISMILFSAYRTMKIFGYGDSVVRNTLILVVFLPIFTIASLSFLSEVVSIGMTMLGILFVALFLRPADSSSRYVYPALGALSFVAAAFSRVDFEVFQVAGLVPFVIAEVARSRNVTRSRARFGRVLLVVIAYGLPAVLFFFFPNYTGVGLASNVGVAAGIAPSITGIPEVVIRVVTTVVGHTTVINSTTLVTSVTSTVTTTSTMTRISATYNSPYVVIPNTFRLFGLGLALGFNPAYAFMVIISFLILFAKVFRGRNVFGLCQLWLGFLSLGTVAGISLIFATVTSGVPLSTVIRDSYDAVPAFFILIPPLLAKAGNKKFYTIVAVVLLLFGVGVSASYGSFLQSNLGEHYPFLSGHDPFLTPQYRTPCAQIRDYLRSTQDTNAVVLRGDLYQSCWEFTPGVAAIRNLTLGQYLGPDAQMRGTHTFYLYVDRDQLRLLNGSNAYLREIYSLDPSFHGDDLRLNTPTTSVVVKDINVIFDKDSFYFARVTADFAWTHSIRPE